MPSRTAKQRRTMAAAAHSKAFAKRLGIPQKVAKEFNQADPSEAETEAEEVTLKTAAERAVVGTPFPKGVSGNPGGRPKGIAARAREYGSKALEVLGAALDDADARVRITAAKELMDRGYGKPIVMTADVSRRLDDIADESLDAAIATLRQSLGIAGDADLGEGAPTEH